jgi:hypothetical protein
MKVLFLDESGDHSLTRIDHAAQMKQARTRYAVPSLEPSELRGVRDVNKATGGLLGPRRQGAEGSPEERALPGETLVRADGIEPTRRFPRFSDQGDVISHS